MLDILSDNYIHLHTLALELSDHYRNVSQLHNININTYRLILAPNTNSLIIFPF